MRLDEGAASADAPLTLMSWIRATDADRTRSGGQGAEGRVFRGDTGEGEGVNARGAGVWRHAWISRQPETDGPNAQRAAAAARETKGEVGLNRAAISRDNRAVALF